MSECVIRNVGEAAERVARAREELECAQTADATERARRELDEAVRVLKAARGKGTPSASPLRGSAPPPPGSGEDGSGMIPVLGVVS